MTLFLQSLLRFRNWIDRIFFKKNEERDEKLYELSRDVMTHTSPEEMAETLIHVIRETLNPKVVALYLATQDGRGFEQLGSNSTGNLPGSMPEKNSLSTYFIDHTQPFILDHPKHNGELINTRTS